MTLIAILGPLCVNLPPYTQGFARTYRQVADNRDIPLVPRLLGGVAERDPYMQADRIHPNAAGHGRIVDNVWPKLRGLLEPAR